MAATKRKTKSASRGEKYTAELSSGQLVIGVGILLVFGLACFLLGVLIGKFDPTLQENMANNDGRTSLAAAPGESSSAASQPEVPAIKRKELPPEMRVPTKTAVPAPKKDATSKPAETSNTIPESARKKTEKSAVPKPTPAKKPAAATPAPTPVKPTATASQSLPKQPIPTPPKTTPQPKNEWYIQIAAFKIRSNAEKERQRLQRKVPYSVSLLSIPNNNYVKVIIDDFPSRAAAQKVKKELLSQYGLKDALIKKKDGGV